ncbi:MAG: cytidine deaminase, partial [Eubacteriales bacterium]
AIAIVCSGKSPAAPCGVCRQVLREFCKDDMPVVFADKDRNVIESTLGELLPHSFGPEDLL